MAFTPLDTSDPAQNEFARLGAGRIRDLASAVRERLASIFNDPDSDPLTLKPGTVGAGQIVDGSVGTAELADASVTDTKLVTGSVTASKIPDGSIEIPKLSASARAALTDRQVVTTIMIAIVTIGAVVAANSSQLFFNTVAAGGPWLGKTLIAYFSVSPAATLATDAVQKGIVLQVVALGNDIGVVAHNRTAGAIDMTGYSIEIAVLVDP